MITKEDLDPLELTEENFMVRLPGQHASFRCNCGCNVFSKLKNDLTKFVCNSCELVWHGE